MSLSPDGAISRSTGASALSLYHLLDPDVLANPYPLFRRLRTEDPVHWDPFLHTWVVTRYVDVLEVLHTFSANRTHTPEKLQAMGLSQMGPLAQLMVKQMLFMDPPAHTRLRALASYAFSPARVAVLRSHIREIVNRLLDEVQKKGQMDLIADLAEPLPGIVTAEMLGSAERPASAQRLVGRLRGNAGELSAQPRARSAHAAHRAKHDRLFS